MQLEEAIAVIVPVSLDLQERHKRGEKLYVASLGDRPGPDGLARVSRACRRRPPIRLTSTAWRRSCSKPSSRGDARSERLLAGCASSTRWSRAVTSGLR